MYSGPDAGSPLGGGPEAPHPSRGRLSCGLEGCAVAGSIRARMSIAGQGRSTSPTALLAATPVSASGSSMADILTRASATRNVEACVLLVFLLCIISFQHTLSWQVMILAVIKPMVPSFLNGHKVKAIPRRDGRCSVQQMPMKICVHLPPHLSGKTSDR